MHKPPGPASASFARRVGRLVGAQKVGHTGTLDPFASGVLPVCLGEATKIASYITDAHKAYRGRMRLGVTTDTYDSQGQVVASADKAVSLAVAHIETALQNFRGVIQQVPPAFSAKKIDGIASYKLARKGREVSLPAQTVEIFELTITRYDWPHLDFEVRCSKGTYIRSLAHDLGQQLGCGAHLTALCRSAHGRFTLEEAMTLESLEAAAQQPADLAALLERSLIIPNDALGGLPAILLDAEHVRYVRSGGDLNAPWLRRLLVGAGEAEITKILDARRNLVALVAGPTSYKYLRVFN